jgi:hypothetical protein
MDNRTITKLSLIAVIASSLLAVVVVAAISMVEEADAQRNSFSQSNSARIGQSNTGGSFSATITQSNRASTN